MFCPTRCHNEFCIRCNFNNFWTNSISPMSMPSLAIPSTTPCINLHRSLFHFIVLNCERMTFSNWNIGDKFETLYLLWENFNFCINNDLLEFSQSRLRFLFLGINWVLRTRIKYCCNLTNSKFPILIETTTEYIAYLSEKKGMSLSGCCHNNLFVK